LVIRVSYGYLKVWNDQKDEVSPVKIFMLWLWGCKERKWQIEKWESEGAQKEAVFILCDVVWFTRIRETK